MIIKIQGEQPFQVLSTSFSISPSSSGYDLMASADGVNYSKLFTVGANTNRQVTQVAAGSYYKLSGNTDSAVTVNWYGNCVDGNGGGGGGTQYTAGDGIQISGSAISVKAGEGLSFSGDTLIATCGGGGADVKTIELSTWNPEDFTQEDISALTEMVEYLADFPVSGLPMARIYVDGVYYTLQSCNYDPADPEEEIPETRYQYRFANLFGEGYENGEMVGYCDTQYWLVDVEDVTNTVYAHYSPQEAETYSITDDLEGDAYAREGKMAFVKEHVKNEYEGVKIYIDDFEHFTESTDGRAENYIAMIHWGDWDESIDGEEGKNPVNIYQSGNQFHWNWENDGQIHTRELERDGDYYTILYRCVGGDDENGSEAYFEFYPIDETPYGDYIFDYTNYVTGETIVYEEIEPSTKYTYKKVGDEEAWVKQQDSHYLYVGNPDSPDATEDELIAFYNAVMANIGDHWYMDINNDGLNRFEYLHMGEGKPVFTADYGGGVRKGYALDADGTLTMYHQDSPEVPNQEYIYVDSGGTINTEGLGNIPSEQPYKIWMRYDSTSSLNPDLTDSSYAPIKYLYRQYEDINDEAKLVYYLCAEIMIGGTLYKGTWHFVEFEWGDQPLAADTWAAV